MGLARPVGAVHADRRRQLSAPRFGIGALWLAISATAASGAAPTAPVPAEAVAAYRAGAYDRAATGAQAAAIACFDGGPAKARCLDLMQTAARYLVAARRFEEATVLGRAANVTAEQLFGKDSRENAAALIARGPAEGGLDNPGLAVNLLGAAADILRKTDPDSLALAEAIGLSAAAADDEEFAYGDQEQPHREALRIATARVGDRSAILAPYQLRLARNLLGLGRSTEAEAACRKGLDLAGTTAGDQPFLLQQLYTCLGAALTAQARDDEAVPVLRRALALDQARTGEDAWLRVEPLRLLAQAVLKQGAQAEAGALLDRADQAALADPRHRAGESELALTRGRLREAGGDLRGAEASYRLAAIRWAVRHNEVIGLFRAYEIDRALAANLFAQQRYAEALASYQDAAADIQSVGFIENNPLQVTAAGDVAVARVITGGDVGVARDELRLATARAVASLRAANRSTEDLAAIRQSRAYFKALVGADWLIAARTPPTGK